MPSPPAWETAPPPDSRWKGSGAGTAHPLWRGVPKDKSPPQDEKSQNDDMRMRSKRRKNLEVVADDETGIVTVVMENYGFIKCADRDANLFFHFSEFKDKDHKPVVGDEVMFTIYKDIDENRDHASRIEVLQAGTVSFEVVLKDSLKGVIAKELHGGGIRYSSSKVGFGRTGSKRTEAIGGLVRVDPKVTVHPQGVETVVELLEFMERDCVESRVPLREGDEVTFDVFVEKRSGKVGATRITLNAPCPRNRIQGVVSSLQKHCGFIAVDDTKVFFSFHEMLDAVEVREGLEVEFTPGKDKVGKAVATSITILAEGTVQVWTAAEELVTGTVSVALGGKRREATDRGVVEIATEQGERERLTFTALDIKGRDRLLIGDLVQLRVCSKGKTLPRRARDLELLQETKDNLARGCVFSIKREDKLVWVDCEDRKDRVALALADLAPELAQRLRIGMELGFTVIAPAGSGRPSAVRARELPTGTVVRMVVEERVLEGTVVKEAKKNKLAPGRSKESGGLISYSALGDSAKPPLLAFGEGDMAPGEALGVFNIMVGDIVSFQIKLDKQSKQSSATGIRVLQMPRQDRGVIVWPPTPTGRIVSLSRPGSQLHYSSMSCIDPADFSVSTCGTEVLFDRSTGAPTLTAKRVWSTGRSVEVETRSGPVKARVESITSKEGLVAIEQEAAIHPAALIRRIEAEAYRSDHFHPAAVAVPGRGHLLSFWADDVCGPPVQRGDEVMVIVCSHVLDPCIRRAVEVTAVVTPAHVKTAKPAKKLVVARKPLAKGPDGSSGFSKFLRTSQIEALEGGHDPVSDSEPDSDDVMTSPVASKSKDQILNSPSSQPTLKPS